MFRPGFLLLMFLIPALIVGSVAECADIRVRVTWGGAEDSPCFGQIMCTAGEITSLVPLGTESDDGGNTFLAKGHVLISQPAAKAFNGVDITVPWDEKGVLRMRFSPSGNLAGTPIIDIPLSKLLSENVLHPLDSPSGSKTKNRLSVRRVPHDGLRVRMNRDNEVFSPGETFSCEVSANLLPVSEKLSAKLNVQVLRGRETFEVWRNQYDFSLSPTAVPVKVNIPLPQDEGVFDVVFSVLVNPVENPLVKPLTKPLTDGPLHGTVLDPTRGVFQRRVQIITVAQENRSLEEIGNLTTSLVVEIDPAQPRWWETSNRTAVQIPRWNRSNTGSLGSGDAKNVSSPFGQMVELPNRALAGKDTAAVSAGEAFSSESPAATNTPTVAVWEAYPLAVERIGMPHILEVEYPAGVEQTLGISIMEPNISGAILPLGIDSGMNMPAPAVEPTRPEFRWERHRIIFWPKSKTPIVLLTNRHPNKSAFFGKIRILSAGNHLPRLMAETRARSVSEYGSRDWSERNKRNDRIAAASDFPLPSGPPEMESVSAIPSGRSAPFHSAPVPAAMTQSPGMENAPVMPLAYASCSDSEMPGIMPESDVYRINMESIALPRPGRVNPAYGADAENLLGVSPAKNRERLIMPMFARPIFHDFFSATKVPGGSAEFTLTDWLTFYDGARRMVEYLNYVGYNGIVLSVYADGGTIYPSRYLASTPRYDSGVFFPTGQDPVQKDVVEMLFRLFDRENLTLIPAMDFSAKIQELEIAAKYSPADGRESIRWRNPAGEEISAKLGENQADAPGYNILHPYVQKVVLDSVSEVVQRYGRHPSFGGISLQLVDNSILLMPGPQWGMDPYTVEQFAAETEMSLPADYRQRVRFLSQNPGLEAWLKWRAQKLALFYQRMTTLLSQNPQAKLYLVGTDVLNETNHPELHPQLGESVTAKDVLLRAGIDTELLQMDPRIVFPRPQKIFTAGNLAECANELQWQNAPGTYREFQAQETPGTAFYHTPELLRLPQFDKVSPHQPTYTWGKSQFTPAGNANRRRYAESLAMMDAEVIIDGGWAPAVGQEDAVRETIRVLRMLPPERFAPARISQTGEVKSQPVIFRSLYRDGENILYAVNRTPFPLEGMVYVRADGSMRYADVSALGQNAVLLGSGKTETLGRNNNGYFWRISLGPYQIEGLKLKGPAVALYDPTATFSGEIQSAFRSRLYEMKTRLEGLKRPSLYVGLRNASFEDVSTNPEIIPQWEVVSAAGNTPGVARLDPRNAHAGNMSLFMTSSGTPIKVMSQPFTATSTGRIFISVWLQPGGNGSFPPLNIILEEDSPETPYRRVARVYPSMLIPGPSQDSAKNSGWMRYVVPVNDLPLGNISQLRLGFELAGAGEVRIDNIHLSDMTFSENERRVLSSLLDTLALRLYHGDLPACVSSLESYWSRFLLENIQPTSFTDSEGVYTVFPPERAELHGPTGNPAEPVPGGMVPPGGMAGTSPGYSATGGIPSELEKEKADSGRLFPRLPPLPPPPPIFRPKTPEDSPSLVADSGGEEPKKKRKTFTDRVKKFFHF